MCSLVPTSDPNYLNSYVKAFQAYVPDSSPTPGPNNTICFVFPNKTSTCVPLQSFQSQYGSSVACNKEQTGCTVSPSDTIAIQACSNGLYGPRNN